LDAVTGALIALLSLVLGAVLKALFDIVSGRELKRYEHSFGLELESFKKDLEQSAFERQVPLSHLYERRLQAIETTYAALRKFRAAAEAYLGRLDAETREGRAPAKALPPFAQAVGETRIGLLETVDEERLWLPDQTLQLLDLLDRHLTTAILASAPRQDPNAKMLVTIEGREYELNMRSFDEAWPSIRAGLNEALQAVEQEFRRLIRTLDEAGDAESPT